MGSPLLLQITGSSGCCCRLLGQLLLQGVGLGLPALLLCLGS